MTVVQLLRARAPDQDDCESDAAIVRRVLDGDIEAFGGLVERHHGRCLTYAQRFLGERADAEDAVQVMFVRAYSALGRYREESRFVGWLFAILTNECRAIASRERRHAKLLVIDEAAMNRAAAPEPVVSDDGERLTAALEMLEPLLREAFLLRHVEELSYAEMMTMTGAGESALKMRVKRACEALRARLEER
jgi:RNA polymerase sigma-70 factor (ECF subfamily)